MRTSSGSTRAIVDGVDKCLEVLANDPWPHPGLLALQVVVGDRRDRFGEFVSFGSVEILRELHVRLVIRRDEYPPEVADSPFY